MNGSSTSGKIGRLLMLFLFVFALWELLFWSLSFTVVLVGILLAFFVTASIGARLPVGIEKLFNPIRWIYLAIYIPYFFYYCVKANLDVAVRVVHPDVPIRPGIVKVHTNLTSELAKAFLANSITLTPGTLTIDIDGQNLYIHWINIRIDDYQKRCDEIVGRFEPLLRRIFE